MISTYHGEETRMKRMKCRQEKQKPVSGLDYNENLGGIKRPNLSTLSFGKKENK